MKISTCWTDPYLGHINEVENGTHSNLRAGTRHQEHIPVSGSNEGRASANRDTLHSEVGVREGAQNDHRLYQGRLVPAPTRHDR